MTVHEQNELYRLFKRIHNASDGHRFYDDDILANGKTVSKSEPQISTLVEENLITRKRVFDSNPPYSLMKSVSPEENILVKRWITICDQIQDCT